MIDSIICFAVFVGFRDAVTVGLTKREQSIVLGLEELLKVLVLG
jgi:hypothetical protein